MPSTKGLKLLVRTTQPDYGEWLELLEARRVLLKPHFDSITLRKLGDVECLRSGNSATRLGFARPLVGDKRFSLETQGVFATIWKCTYVPHSGYQAPPGGVSSPDGILHFWGLTRDALWILVAVQFKGEAGYKNSGHQTAVSVDIQEATPARIVEKTERTALEIWRRLGETARSWLQERQILYQHIQNLTTQIAMEEQALALIEE